MYLILAYDVNVSRLSQVLKTARKYLTWVQNSVLEGEITRANLTRLETELKAIINPATDSITLYVLRTTKYFTKKTFGTIKGEPTQIF